MEDQGGDGGAGDADCLVGVPNGAVQDAVGNDLEQTDVEHAQIVGRLDQVVCVVHASQDGHGLDCDHELGALHVSVVMLRELCQKGERDTIAQVVNEPDERHPDIPA